MERGREGNEARRREREVSQHGGGVFRLHARDLIYRAREPAALIQSYYLHPRKEAEDEAELCSLSESGQTAFSKKRPVLPGKGGPLGAEIQKKKESYFKTLGILL